GGGGEGGGRGWREGWGGGGGVMDGAPAFVRPGGRLVFTLFAFLGLERAHRRLRAAGLAPEVVARETHAFPRIGYERLEHLRAADAEGTIPRDQPPRTVERYVLCGRLPR